MERVVEFDYHVAAESRQFALARIEASDLTRSNDFAMNCVDHQTTIAGPGIILYIDPCTSTAVKDEAQKAATRRSQ